ncbi:LuxR C-terminal-related transcriptional regulator [Paradesulfitobacterium aromaticivorans]
MVLSEKTVRNYVTQLLAKLELNNRAEAAAFAVRYRLE